MKNKERMCFGIIIGTRAYFNSELAKDCLLYTSDAADE